MLDRGDYTTSLKSCDLVCLEKSRPDSSTLNLDENVSMLLMQIASKSTYARITLQIPRRRTFGAMPSGLHGINRPGQTLCRRRFSFAEVVSNDFLPHFSPQSTVMAILVRGVNPWNSS